MDINYSLVLDQLITYIEEIVKEGDNALLFKIADHTKLYTARLQQLLLTHFLNQCTGDKKGRDVLIVFKEAIGSDHFIISPFQWFIPREKQKINICNNPDNTQSASLCALGKNQIQV